MMLKTLKLLTAGFAALLLSCAENSPLSDVALTDPSILTLEIDLVKSVSIAGSTADSIEARFIDSKGDWVNLKDGGVKVNGIPMGVRYRNLGAPYYTVTGGQLGVYPDSLYTFTVTLADSQEYKSTLRTRKKDLRAVLGPDSVNTGDTLIIIWAEADSLAAEFLYVKTLGGSGNPTYDYQTRGVTSPWLGSYTVYLATLTSGDPGFYQASAGKTLLSADFTVRVMKFGSIDYRFKSGSFARCTFEASKRVLVQ